VRVSMATETRVRKVVSSGIINLSGFVMNQVLDRFKSLKLWVKMY